MNEDSISYKQALKEQFFKNEDKLFTKKPKFISYNCKDTTAILSSIASNNRFGEIRKRYKVTIFLSKILLKSQFNFVLYAFYRNDILYIATANHIGQSELNMQKLTIISYCKKSIDYKNIKDVKIFRDEKKQEKQKEHIIPRYKERSYGIFENHLTNKKLYNIAQRIKDKIHELN